MLLLELKDVKKSYGTGRNRVQALGKTNLLVPKEDFLAVEGPSGCGKSTLLHVMGLLERPDEGWVRFDGQDIGRATEVERARIRNQEIGFVFQHFNLLPDLTALQNVMLPMVPAKVKWRERRKRAEALLRRVGLDDRVKHRPAEMSGGEQQRVAIARALANHPRLILADEPTGNLDGENAALVLDLFREVQEEIGATVVLVTHDPDVSMRAAKRVLRAFVTK